MKWIMLATASLAAPRERPWMWRATTAVPYAAPRTAITEAGRRALSEAKPIF